MAELLGLAVGAEGLDDTGVAVGSTALRTTSEYVTFRTPLCWLSLIKMSPTASTATYRGRYNSAAVALPPSPTYGIRKRTVEFIPATVVIMPVLTDIFRMRSFPVSAT